MNMLLIILRNCLPMFVTVLILNGGLNQVMFCFFVAVPLSMLFVLVYRRECSYSLLLNVC